MCMHKLHVYVSVMKLSSSLGSFKRDMGELQILTKSRGKATHYYLFAALCRNNQFLIVLPMLVHLHPRMSV